MIKGLWVKVLHLELSSGARVSKDLRFNLFDKVGYHGLIAFSAKSSSGLPRLISLTKTLTMANRLCSKIVWWVTKSYRHRVTERGNDELKNKDYRTTLGGIRRGDG